MLSASPQDDQLELTKELGNSSSKVALGSCFPLPMAPCKNPHCGSSRTFPKPNDEMSAASSICCSHENDDTSTTGASVVDGCKSYIRSDKLHSSNVGRLSMNSIQSSTTSDVLGAKLLGYGIAPQEKKKPRTKSTSLQIQNAVDELHRWLFVGGGHFENVEGLMKEYCLLVRRLNIPVDRLYYGGIGLHPKLTAYLWRWEPNDFEVREMPPEVFERRNELFSPDEPFCVLEQGRVDYVRIRASDDYIPPDTEKWFRAGNYQDYFALPDIHRNQFKGGLAWATKHPQGFSGEDTHFFELTLPALTAVMRLHTNDLVLRTLTERMEQEIEDRTQELADANLNLEQANERLAVQAQKQLEHFACMSHEIRTPLNCVVGLSSLLLESPEELNPSQADSIKMISGSADLLHAVVDDVLDYAKLESGVFEVEIGPTNLEQTLRSVIRSMEPKVAQKNVRISAHYGSTLPECIETDPRRLQQVLYNLLGNAAKFSKPGGVIDVHISLEEAGSQCDGDRVRFSVKDYGKGIDERDFETIFRPFNRASQETQAVYGGTGLGLSISSKLVKRLGGTISVDSKVGEYAEFTVELPVGGSILKQKKIQPLPVLPAISKEHHDGPPVDVIQCPSPSMTGLFAPINDRTEQEGSLEPQSKKLKSSHRSMFGLVSTAGSNVSMSTTVPSCNTVQPSLPATKEGGSVSPRDTTWQPPKSPPRKRLRVLYAEDNIVNQKVFSRILAKLGITDLDIVDNGLEAVEFSATKVYDIIFMDMQMPIMDGLEATRLIKERGGDGDITAPKIVFCTAHAMDDFRWQAEQAGGDGFVSKPFNMKMIDSILQEYE